MLRKVKQKLTKKEINREYILNDKNVMGNICNEQNFYKKKIDDFFLIL